MQSVIHNPHVLSTPSERLQAAAHRERLARIARASVQPTPRDHFAQAHLTTPSAPPIPNRMLRIALEMLEPVRLVNQVDAIQRATLAEYPGVTMTDLKSSRRTADVVRPRQIAMFLAKTLTTRSLPDIGRRFGDRDHTTILHAVHKIGRLIKVDSVLADQIERIKAAFAEASA